MKINKPQYFCHTLFGPISEQTCECTILKVGVGKLIGLHFIDKITDMRILCIFKVEGYSSILSLLDIMLNIDLNPVIGGP